MQGVVLESLPRECFVRYVQMPYWCFHLTFPDTSLRDSYWPSTGIITSESLLVPKGRESGCEEGLLQCCQYFCDEIFPVMEQVHDDRSFLESPKRIVSRDPTECYPLLYLSYLEGSWDYAENWLKKRKAEETLREEQLLQKRWENVWPRNSTEAVLFEKHFQSVYDEQKRNIAVHVEKAMARQYRIVFERMESNDLNWIKAIHDSEISYMQAKIRSEFHLNV